MPFLTRRYAHELVAASLLIATFASYVSLDLAARVRSQDRAVARAWWICGSAAMGTGFWAMHFFGRFAYSLPIELGYRGLQTLASWVAAVAVSPCRPARLGPRAQPGRNRQGRVLTLRVRGRSDE